MRFPTPDTYILSVVVTSNGRRFRKFGRRAIEVILIIIVVKQRQHPLLCGFVCWWGRGLCVWCGNRLWKENTKQIFISNHENRFTCVGAAIIE